MDALLVFDPHNYLIYLRANGAFVTQVKRFAHQEEVTIKFRTPLSSPAASDRSDHSDRGSGGSGGEDQTPQQTSGFSQMRSRAQSFATTQTGTQKAVRSGHHSDLTHSDPDETLIQYLTLLLAPYVASRRMFQSRSPDLTSKLTFLPKATISFAQYQEYFVLYVCDCNAYAHDVRGMQRKVDLFLEVAKFLFGSALDRLKEDHSQRATLNRVMDLWDTGVEEVTPFLVEAVERLHVGVDIAQYANRLLQILLARLKGAFDGLDEHPVQTLLFVDDKLLASHSAVSRRQAGKLSHRDLFLLTLLLRVHLDRTCQLKTDRDHCTASSHESHSPSIRLNGNKMCHDISSLSSHGGGGHLGANSGHEAGTSGLSSAGSTSDEDYDGDLESESEDELNGNPENQDGAQPAQKDALEHNQYSSISSLDSHPPQSTATSPVAHRIRGRGGFRGGGGGGGGQGADSSGISSVDLKGLAADLHRMDLNQHQHQSRTNHQILVDSYEEELTKTGTLLFPSSGWSRDPHLGLGSGRAPLTARFIPVAERVTLLVLCETRSTHLSLATGRLLDLIFRLQFQPAHQCTAHVEQRLRAAIRELRSAPEVKSQPAALRPVIKKLDILARVNVTAYLRDLIAQRPTSQVDSLLTSLAHMLRDTFGRRIYDPLRVLGRAGHQSQCDLAANLSSIRRSAESKLIHYVPYLQVKSDCNVPLETFVPSGQSYASSTGCRSSISSGMGSAAAGLQRNGSFMSVASAATASSMATSNSRSPSLTSSGTAQQRPDCAYFLYIDRTSNEFIESSVSPTLESAVSEAGSESGSASGSLDAEQQQEEISNMIPQLVSGSYAMLSKGKFSHSWLLNDAFVLSYFMWFEDSTGKSLKPEVKRFKLNQVPSLVTADTIEHIKAFCFPSLYGGGSSLASGPGQHQHTQHNNGLFTHSLSSSMSGWFSSSPPGGGSSPTGGIHCYELFNIHRKPATGSGVDRIAIVESAKRLAAKLWSLSAAGSAKLHPQARSPIPASGCGQAGSGGGGSGSPLMTPY